MNSTATTERERRLLASVASDYERRGYQVKVQPGAGDMPEFLAGFEPDLIATGTGESVVVEVKARRELENEQTLAAIEAALQNRPGWRFELIIDGSERDLGPLLGAPQIWTSLEEANELQQGGRFKASFLLLWAATEGILRLFGNARKWRAKVSSAGICDHATVYARPDRTRTISRIGRSPATA